MKSEKTNDEQFQWDMTVVIIIVLAIMFLMLLMIDIGSLKHVQ